MSERVTLGNFFSGSGCWELAAKLCGATPTWESEIEPFPVQLEAKRFPECKQLGDITKVSGYDIEPCDIMTNSSPCFAGDSLVRTSEGLKQIKDVQIGDRVLTHNNRYRTVLDSACTGIKTVYKVESMGADSIICTDNHPFLVRKRTRHYPTFYVDGVRKRGNRREFSEPEWKQLKDLDGSYFIGTAVNQNSVNCYNLTDEELWLVGRYVADGYRHKKSHSVIFCIGYAKEDDFKTHLKNYRGCDDRQRTALKIRISDKRLHKLCGDCGDGAINKEFPSWVIDLPKEQLAIVIDGYMSGDGNYNKNGKYLQAGTISIKLAYSLMQAVQKVYGYHCSISKYEREKHCVIEGRVVNQHDIYTVRFKEPRKQDNAFFEDGHAWYPIRKITKVGEREVYNLSVEEDESYTVQNIMVHNCQDISVAGKRKGMEQGSDTRSSLFHEVIRITKEMREHEFEQLRMRQSDKPIQYVRPYIWCWENVCGALSSGNPKGEDFRCVLEEIARVIDPEVHVPSPKNGKWTNAGCLDGNGWSIAWCVRNAANEGVPQRRRRVFLVADFTGNSATEILFERKGLPWNFKAIRETWQDTSRSLEERIVSASEYIRSGVAEAADGEK